MRLLTSAAILIALTGPAPSAEPMLKLMQGIWRGDDRFVLIDTERMLGNVEPHKPFQRDPLRLRNIAGQMVVFEIGNRRYIGLFERDELHLTGEGINGSVTLRR